MKEQVTKLRLSTFIQTDDLSIKNYFARTVGEKLRSPEKLKGCPLREIGWVRPFWMTASERNPAYFSSKIHSG
jgi:hypothetical protein